MQARQNFGQQPLQFRFAIGRPKQLDLDRAAL
jgi:hypothetical protein